MLVPLVFSTCSRQLMLGTVTCDCFPVCLLVRLSQSNGMLAERLKKAIDTEKEDFKDLLGQLTPTNKHVGLFALVSAFKF